MRRTLPALLLLVVTACSPASDQTKLPSLDDLLAKHTEARGGAAAIEGVQSVRVELEIIEPDFTVTGSYVATREGHMRIDIFADGNRVFTEALGPDGGWQMFGDGRVADLSADGHSALVRGVAANLFGLHERAALGYSLELFGEVTHNDKAYYELEEVAPDGFSKRLYMDPSSYLITRDLETSALHPDIDATKERKETLSMDFRASGVGEPVYSNKQETRNIDTSELMQTATITGRTINGPVDASRFNRPKGAPAE